MAGGQKHLLVDQGTAAECPHALWKAKIVSLDEDDERTDVGKQVQDVHDASGRYFILSACFDTLPRWKLQIPILELHHDGTNVRVGLVLVNGAVDEAEFDVAGILGNRYVVATDGRNGELHGQSYELSVRFEPWGLLLIGTARAPSGRLCERARRPRRK